MANSTEDANETARPGIVSHLKWAVALHIPWCVVLLLLATIAVDLRAGDAGIRELGMGLAYASVFIPFIVAVAALPNLFIATASWWLSHRGLGWWTSALAGVVLWPLVWRILSLPPDAAESVPLDELLTAVAVLAVAGGIYGGVLGVLARARLYWYHDLANRRPG